MTCHTIRIPRWKPVLTNTLMGNHWAKAAKLKKADMQMVSAYCLQAGIPRAKGKRRVELVVEIAGRGRTPDPDSMWKSLLDALKQAGMLVDDSGKWCEIVPPQIIRKAKETATTIQLTELD